jgi:hypothetical protein
VVGFGCAEAVTTAVLVVAGDAVVVGDCVECVVVVGSESDTVKPVDVGASVGIGPDSVKVVGAPDSSADGVDWWCECAIGVVPATDSDTGNANPVAGGLVLVLSAKAATAKRKQTERIAATTRPNNESTPPPTVQYR